MADFEPKILALCCHYCAYAAADLAGSMRLQYSPNVRVLRLPCTGKLDIGYVMRAFEKGVDGVIVAGCLEGGCHFQEGNLRAKKRIALARQVLEEAGFDSSRLEMYNLSSAMGQTFADIVDEMAERIKKLGPNPLRHQLKVEGREVINPVGADLQSGP
ncbi:MAG: heterodisulfide reductase subunit MvhD [Armatimonadetes bacterium RBG_16_58_9]|nr:MAG: heterodisulfide reductase subunit MvhD [Armatimonadetes bacterium RBG_16_58_9]